MNMLAQTKRQATYKERLLAQKIQLLEIAIKANLQNPTIHSLSALARAKSELFEFMRGVS